MVSFPNAKINLGLRVLRMRQDGFHEIDSCFYPVPWNDILEIVKSEKFNFSATGLPIPGDTDNNLCIKAFNFLKTDFDIGNVAIHLHKVIPMGAGLGGGSADGAFTLVSLNKLFNLGLTNAELRVFAAKLGSDCPFFIDNQPSIVGGRGEKLAPSKLSLTGTWIVLVNPDIHIPTAEAYSSLKPAIPNQGVKEVLHQPNSEWQEHLINDFENPIAAKHQEIDHIKKQLLDAGAFYSSMTGSGSTVFGLFESEPNIKNLDIWSLYKTELV